MPYLVPRRGEDVRLLLAKLGGGQVMTLDFSKPITTRDGRVVDITWHDDRYIVGYAGGYFFTWHVSGIRFNGNENPGIDLINPSSGGGGSFLRGQEIIERS